MARASSLYEPFCGLVEDHAAVDHERLAGHVIRLSGRKEGCGARNVIGCWHNSGRKAVDGDAFSRELTGFHLCQI